MKLRFVEKSQTEMYSKSYKLVFKVFPSLPLSQPFFVVDNKCMTMCAVVQQNI